MTTPHRTLQEAAHMALDALDAITDDVDGTGLNTMPSFDKAIDAITALRAALAAPQAEPWMSIETAPKDGTPLLLLTNERWKDCRPGTQFVGINRGNLSEWCFYAPVGMGGIPDAWLDGWMPIPAAADHLRDTTEKAAPAAPVPDGWVMVPKKELGNGISLLHQAMVGACDCLTKTHEAKYHAESCFYRRLSEQCDKLEGAISASPAAPVVPLTDEQIRTMWMSSEFRGNGGQVDWFCEGIRAAEAHHGITGGKP